MAISNNSIKYTAHIKLIDKNYLKHLWLRFLKENYDLIYKKNKDFLFWDR